MIDRHQPEICGACGGPSGPNSYAPHNRRKLIPVCPSRACLRIVRNTYHMARDVFDGLSTDALRAGGAEGGAYLDQIGKTDLAHLSEPEWNEFLRRIDSGRRRAIIELLEPPFNGN